MNGFKARVRDLKSSTLGTKHRNRSSVETLASYERGQKTMRKSSRRKSPRVLYALFNLTSAPKADGGVGEPVSPIGNCLSWGKFQPPKTHRMRKNSGEMFLLSLAASVSCNPPSIGKLTNEWGGMTLYFQMVANHLISAGCKSETILGLKTTLPVIWRG